MQTLKNIMFVGCGGFVGSSLRYLASVGVQQIFKTESFPLGTAIVNISGCLIIGFLGGWSDHIQPFSQQARLFLFLGLLGGFTTFSTFGYETIALLRNREILWAFVNVAMQLLLGFGAVLLGYSCSGMLINKV